MKNLMYRASIEMFLLRQKARDLLTNKSGATMIEYTVLIALITVALVVLIGTVGGKLVLKWTALNTAIT